MDSVPPPPPPPSSPSLSEGIGSPPPPPPVSPPPPPMATPQIITPKKSVLGRKLLFIGLGLIVILAIAAIARYFLTNRSALGSEVTLTYWGLWEQDSVLRPILDEYQTAHPKIKIDYKMQSPNEYRERLHSALGQGKGPDIFRIHNTWVPMFKNFLDPLPEEVYPASDYKNDFYPVAQKDLRLDASYAGIPLEFDGLAMFINEDLRLPTGLEVPKNWDEVRDLALAIAKCDNSLNPTSACTGQGVGRILVAGAALGSVSNVDHWQDILSLLMLQNGVDLNNPKSPTPQGALDSFAYYKDFKASYHVWDDSLPPSTTQFANGRLGIYFGPSWRVFDILAINPRLKFGVHPLPQTPKDPLRHEEPITWATYWVESVNKKSPAAQEAWKLLKYLSSPEVQERLYASQVASGRPFGEPYSRPDMASKLVDVPHVSSFVAQAPFAQSWYLASHTQDGPTGINTRTSDAFKQALEDNNIDILAKAINEILSQYGLSSSQTVN